MAQVDRVEALRRIEASPSKRRQHARNLRADVIVGAIVDRKASCRAAVEALANHEPDFAVCDYGRVHTPFTRLMSVVRPMIAFNGISGIPAVVDVKNSQPVFLALLLKRVDPVAFDQRDAKLFVQRVVEGRLYDQLMHELGLTDRGKFKGEFFRDVLFGDAQRWYTRDSKIAALFARQYPTVWQFILEQKQGSADDAHAELARKMQRQESRFMIEGVCGRLAVEHPSIPILTCHDSIFTIDALLPIVTRVIAEQFATLGIRPTLDEKLLVAKCSS